MVYKPPGIDLETPTARGIIRFRHIYYYILTNLMPVKSVKAEIRTQKYGGKKLFYLSMPFCRFFEQ